MSITTRLDAYLESKDLEAVWFARPASFAWLTGGDNVVDRDSVTGIAAAGYDGDGVTVVTDNIEADRLREEELRPDVDVETFEWHASDLRGAVKSVSPTPAAADIDVEGFKRLDPVALRQPLTDGQIESYRALSVDVADTLERVARNCDPDHTELGVATMLRRELEGTGISTPVVLVGGAERAQRYRHFTPTEHRLGDYAILSVCVTRDGLYTSATRTVAFDPPEWLQERTRKAMRVETTALAATREIGAAGGTASDVFGVIQDAYASLGWDGEWRHHHQGGAAGFSSREWVATPDSDRRVHLPQAYAWNPTVQGAKSEDTHLVTDDGIETLSVTDDWPTTPVSAVGYDVDIERPKILER